MVIMKHNSNILCINGFPKWFSQIYQTFQSMKVYKWENHQLDCNHLLRVTYVTIVTYRQSLLTNGLPQQKSTCLMCQWLCPCLLVGISAVVGWHPDSCWPISQYSLYLANNYLDVLWISQYRITLMNYDEFVRRIASTIANKHLYLDVNKSNVEAFI